LKLLIIASKKFNVVPDQAMLDLDNESKIWCFVCSLRCLIYKVHAAWRSSVILPLSKSFVKNFFQSFFKLFRSLIRRISFKLLTAASLRSAAALVSSSVILPLGFDFVKNFFQIFQIFFGSRVESIWFDVRSLKRSVILPLIQALVNRF